MTTDEQLDAHYEYMKSILEKARALSICYPPEDIPDYAVEEIVLSSIQIREEIDYMFKTFADNFLYRLTLSKAGDPSVKTEPSGAAATPEGLDEGPDN